MVQTPALGYLAQVEKEIQARSFIAGKMQLGALNKAMTRKSLGLEPSNGKDQNQNPILRLELPGAGRGYRPNKKDTENPHLNENMNWFEVKFDKKDKDRPFTAFPSEKK